MDVDVHVNAQRFKNSRQWNSSKGVTDLVKTIMALMVIMRRKKYSKSCYACQGTNHLVKDCNFVNKAKFFFVKIQEIYWKD